MGHHPPKSFKARQVGLIKPHALTGGAPQWEGRELTCARFLLELARPHLRGAVQGAVTGGVVEFVVQRVIKKQSVVDYRVCMLYVFYWSVNSGLFALSWAWRFRDGAKIVDGQ